MSLGCDVTTYYAAKVELGSRDLYRNEINLNNPYNTRRTKYGR
jgi:cell division protein YceG involved in septum cleavage